MRSRYHERSSVMKNVASLILALVSLVSLSCAPRRSVVTPTTADQVSRDRLFAFQTPSGDTNSILTVTRVDSQNSCDVALYINEVHVANFEIRETTTFYVPPGETLLQIRLAAGWLCDKISDVLLPEREQKILLKPNEHKFFSIILYQPSSSGCPRPLYLLPDPKPQQLQEIKDLTEPQN